MPKAIFYLLKGDYICCHTGIHKLLPWDLGLGGFCKTPGIFRVEGFCALWVRSSGLKGLEFGW